MSEQQTEQKPIQRDAAIIIKCIKDDKGNEGIDLQLVFTRPQSSDEPESEAEAFAKFSFNAVAKLYEQLTNPPTIQTAPPPRSGPMRMEPQHPGQNFTPPILTPGEPGDLKR